MIESMLPSKRLVFAYSSNGKGLTGESSQKKVMRRYCFGIYLRDIPNRGMLFPICEHVFVCFYSIFVDFGGKNTFSPHSLEAEPDAANSRKQIDEGERASTVRQRREKRGLVS